jgi:Integral peroxisomal membrane peroxin
MSRSTAYTPTNGPTSPQPTYDPNPVTTAAFSPTSTSGWSATSKQRSTIIVHKKSPLLVATPPQITRALAHSHPFLLPLNKLAGLITWTTDDPWESYLLVAGFWAITLYGDYIVRFASPVILVTLLIVGMYSRRYSPLSSTSRTGEKHNAKSHKREPSEASSSPHHKSLDEIVDTLQQFTSRCNILLEPFLSLTDFLSTQRTPTSATTRPALTTLFIRILLVTPLWVTFTLPPFYILTTRRVILFIGTTILSWHSRPARVTRTILWRSVFIRRLSSFITGLSFPSPHAQSSSSATDAPNSQSHLATLKATNKKPTSSGVRFTFILYENQRRWIGLGWTTSLFAYERGPWTDENLNPAPSKDEFDLPDVDGGAAKWRWLDGSDWHIERGDAKKHARNASTGSRTGPTGSTQNDDGNSDGGGWIYYDNRWEDGRREDGWGRYTRRRKWYRDAELVEVTPSMEPSPIGTPRDAPLDKKDFEAPRESEKSEGEEEKIRRARDYARNLTPTLTSSTPAIAVPDTSKANTDLDVPGNSVSSALSPTSASTSAKKKSAWFGRNRDTGARERSDSKSSSSKNTGITQSSTRSRDGPDEDVLDKWRDDARHRGYSVQEDVVMGLG